MEVGRRSDAYRLDRRFEQFHLGAVAMRLGRASPTWSVARRLLGIV
jgi:hypothetical protein